MSKHILYFMAISFFGLVLRNAYAMTKDAIPILEKLEKREVLHVSTPPFVKGKLPMGIRYYMLQDDTSKIVHIFAIFAGGGLYEPLEKKGLAAFTLALMRIGGAGRLSGDDIDKKLDELGSSVTLTDSGEYMLAELVCRSEYLKETMEIFLDILFTPRFEENKFDLVKLQTLSSIKRREDSPSTLAKIGFSSVVYGKNSPWGAYPTTQTADNISMEDVKEWHKRFFYPKNMILAISGDFSKRFALHVLKSYDNYPSEVQSLPTLPEPTSYDAANLAVIDKDITQSTVMIGHEGTSRYNPDKYALIVMNNILGGAGFKSRLPSKIRVSEGLAYTVKSDYVFGPSEGAGLFYVTAATKNDTVYDAIKIAVSEIESIKEKGVTADELEASRSSILNRLVFEYQTPHDTVFALARFSFYGYPDNYFEEYANNIAKLTVNDVNNVANKYLFPDKLKIVVVGPWNMIQPTLKGLGNVTLLSIDN